MRKIAKLATDKIKKSAYIVGPMIMFETGPHHRVHVDVGKKRIYELPINFFKEKYSRERIEVIGLFIGSHRTISKF